MMGTPRVWNGLTIPAKSSERYVVHFFPEKLQVRSLITDPWVERAVYVFLKRQRRNEGKRKSERYGSPFDVQYRGSWKELLRKEDLDNLVRNRNHPYNIPELELLNKQPKRYFKSESKAPLCYRVLTSNGLAWRRKPSCFSHHAFR